MELHWRQATFDELGTPDLYAILRLRQAVFVVEQACVYLDLDGLDQCATHIFASLDGAVVACLRCLPPGSNYPESSIGRVVVAQAQRGRRLGETLMARGIEHNLRRWPDSDICISAQSHLQDFYRGLGFLAEGEEYLEDGIPHRKMRFASP